jgi:hypothetical protein
MIAVPRLSELRFAALAALVAALLKLPMFYGIETGGDAIGNWLASETLFSLDRISLNIDISRLGIHIPCALIGLLLPAGPWSYLAGPLLIYAGSVFLACRMAERHFGGRRAAWIVAAMMTFYPLFGRQATQMLPGMFEAFYVLAAFFCALRYVEEPEPAARKPLWIALCGVAIAFGYMAKLTTLFVAPGLLAFFLLYKTRARHLLLWAGVMAAIYGCEHLYFALNGWPGGQLQMLIAEPNRDNPRAEYALSREVHSFRDFFARYTVEGAGRAFHDLLFASALSVLWIRLFGSARARRVVLALGIFLLINTFAVSRIHPTVLMITRPIDRYTSVYAPMLMILLAYVLAGLVTQIRTGTWRERRNFAPVLGLAVAAIALLLPMAPTYARSAFSLKWQLHDNWSNGNYLSLYDTYRELYMARKATVPLVGVDYKRVFFTAPILEVGSGLGRRNLFALEKPPIKSEIDDGRVIYIGTATDAAAHLGDFDTWPDDQPILFTHWQTGPRPTLELLTAGDLRRMAAVRE